VVKRCQRGQISAVHLCNEHFLAVVLDGKSEVAPRPRLTVVLENRQQEHKVCDVQNVLVLVTLQQQSTSTYPLGYNVLQCFDTVGSVAGRASGV